MMLLRTLRRGRRLWRDRGGNLTVEMAFMVPLVILTTLGIVDIGQGVWTVSALDNAAREGVRYAAVHGPNANTLGWTATEAEIIGVVRNAYVGLNSDQIQDSDITIDYSDGFGASGAAVAVRISVDFHFFTYGGLTGKTVTLTGESLSTMM